MLKHLRQYSFVFIVKLFPPLIEPIQLQLPTVAAGRLLEEIVFWPLILHALIPRHRVVFLLRRHSADPIVALRLDCWLFWYQRLGVWLILGRLRSLLLMRLPGVIRIWVTTFTTLLREVRRWRLNDKIGQGILSYHGITVVATNLAHSGRLTSYKSRFTVTVWCSRLMRVEFFLWGRRGYFVMRSLLA